MKYFYDTEFHEDSHTIDLISIGIVAEDGREYYAVNRDADWDRIEKHVWLMANVVDQLPDFDVKVWKFKERIREDVAAFFAQDNGVELWAWYSAYDHVALAQLFGTMLDLPEEIPMHTNDVRSLSAWTGVDELPTQHEGNHDALADARHVQQMFNHIEQTGDQRLDRVREVASDLFKRGRELESKNGGNGSIRDQRDDGRGTGYLDASRYIERALQP